MSNFLSAIIKPKAWISTLLIVTICAALFYYSSTPHHDTLKEFLDNKPFTIEIGKHKISVYDTLKTLIILIIFLWIAGLLSDFGKSQIKRVKGVSPSTTSLLTKIYSIAVYAIGFLIGIQILGINLASFAIFSGAIGIGLGFGLQKVTSNFISGMILLFEKSVEINDLVELDDGTTGYVRRIGLRYILIEGLNGRKVMVPNENFITNPVVNWTYSSKNARVDINIGIDYNDDTELALKLLKEAALENERCLRDPMPSAFITNFAPSAIDLSLSFWVQDITEGRFGPKSDVMQRILKKFKDNNISIPYPHTEMRVVNIEKPSV